MKSTLALLLVATLVSCTFDEQPSTSAFRERSATLTVSPTPIGTEAAIPTQYSTGDYMSVAGLGDEQLLAFYDGGNIRAVRFDDAGTVLDVDAWIRTGRNDDREGSQAYTDLAYGGGVYMIVYADSLDAAPGVYVQVIDPSGELLSEPQLVHPSSWYGAVVFNGTDFTVAYMGDGIGLCRVGLDGTVLSETKAQVTSDGMTNRPVLAMAADMGLVVFDRGIGDGERRVFAARFTPEGEVLDPGAKQVSETSSRGVDVSVAAGQSEFLMVWGAAESQVNAAIMDFEGTVSRTEFPISSPGAVPGGSGVAFDGTNYLAVWQQDGDEGSSVLVGARLSPSGDRVDGSDVVLAENTRAGQSFNLDLAWTGDDYALVYTSSDLGGGIKGGLLDSELTRADEGEFPLTVLPSRQQLVGTAFTGVDYVVAWTHEADDSAERQYKSTRIDTGGTIVNAQADLLSSGGTDLFLSATSVAANAQGTLYSYTESGDTQTTFVRYQSSDGALAEPLAIEAAKGEPLQIQSNGEGFFGIYSAGENANGNPVEVWGQLLGPTGAPQGEPFLLVEIGRPRAQLFASGDGYLVVVAGQEVGGEPIAGTVLQLAADGTVIKDHGPYQEERQFPSVASNGTHSLFVWEDGETEAVFGRLLEHAAGYSDVFQVSEETSSGGVAAGFSMDRFVVVWPEMRKRLLGREVTVEGNVSAIEEILQGDVVYPVLTPGLEGQLLLTTLRYTEWSRSTRVDSRLLGIGESPPVVTPPDPVTGSGGAADPILPSAGGASTGGAAAGGAVGGSVVGAGGEQAPTESGGTGTGATENSGSGSSAPALSERNEGGCTYSTQTPPRTVPWLLLALFAVVLGRGARRVNQGQISKSS